MIALSSLFGALIIIYRVLFLADGMHSGYAVVIDVYLDGGDDSDDLSLKPNSGQRLRNYYGRSQPDHRRSNKHHQVMRKKWCALPACLALGGLPSAMRSLLWLFALLEKDCSQEHKKLCWAIGWPFSCGSEEIWASLRSFLRSRRRSSALNVGSVLKS